jgi:lipopolysaccharide/colanic/teichoic acid biosynthesis glycosyltransferase
MYKIFFKRVFDFCISLIALIILSPFLLIISIWLYIANGKGSSSLEGGVWGRLFFTQERPGKDAKIFKVIKFKSMTDERDAEGNLLPDKDRITTVGKFVRKTSLDELPQLINVLKGDMSLIGPRPLLVEYLPYYTEREQLRHTVRPGISGWAQSHGRNNLGWDEKLALDVYYVEHLSFWMDCRIIFTTIKNVLGGKDVNIVPSLKGGKLSDERRNKMS